MNMTAKKSAQFIHIETYSDKKQARKKNKNGNEILDRDSDFRETTTTGVLGEALRVERYCSHVDNPEPPQLLYGVDIHGVEALVADYRANFKLIDSKGKKRSLRKDACALLAGTISLKREDIDDWEDYKKASIDYLIKKYGHKLKSVIEHTDEKPLHIHFFVVADHDEVLNDLHEGKKAVSDIRKQNRKSEKEDKKTQKLAYNKAMIEFQDDFYISVAKKFGFSRTGEKPRTRIPETSLYKKAEAERLAQLEMIEEKKKEVEILNNTLINKNLLIEEAKNEGIKKGIDLSINKFSKENYFNKFVFSISKLNEYRKESEFYKDRAIKINLRKNHYKSKLTEAAKKNKENGVLFEKIKSQNEILNKINFFMFEEPEINTPGEKNDIRSRIIGQISEIENQQQQISPGLQEFSNRINRFRARAGSVKNTIRRTLGVLQYNIKEFLGNFFTFEFFEGPEKFEENSQQINKPTKTEKSEERNENRRNDIKRAKFTI